MAIMSVLAIICSTGSIAKSTFLGMLVFFLPNMVFVFKALKQHHARQAKQIAKNFYRGETLKILLAIIMFAIVFKFTIVQPGVFFGAYVVMQLVAWLSMAVAKSK